MLSDPSNASGTETRVDVDLSSFCARQLHLQFFASATATRAATAKASGWSAYLLAAARHHRRAVRMNWCAATARHHGDGHRRAATLRSSRPASSRSTSTIVTNTNDGGAGSLRAAIEPPTPLRGRRPFRSTSPASARRHRRSSTFVSAAPPMIAESVIIDGAQPIGPRRRIGDRNAGPEHHQRVGRVRSEQRRGHHDPRAEPWHGSPGRFLASRTSRPDDRAQSDWHDRRSETSATAMALHLAREHGTIRNNVTPATRRA